MPVTAANTTNLRILLGASLAAVLWLIRPFADVLLVAGVVVVLAWPLHTWIGRRVRGPKALRTAVTVLLLTGGIMGPGTVFAWFVTREVAALAAQLAAELGHGNVETLAAALAGLPWVRWVVEQAGGQAVFAEELRTGVRDGFLGVATQLGQSVPALLGGTARSVLKVTIFFLAISTFFHRGESLARWAQRMSPLAHAHTARLFEVFAEFARNVVLAGVVAAAVQGAVAGLGYWIGGVERPLFFAVLTGALSFVPLLGTAAAWVPITILLLLQGHFGAALFVTVWSLALTGTIDNLVKPLIVRGRSNMPALVVFLGVFGGLSWFGVVGILVGPVLMALLMALLHLYEESLPPADGGEGRG